MPVDQSRIGGARASGAGFPNKAGGQINRRGEAMLEQARKRVAVNSLVTVIERDGAVDSAAAAPPRDLEQVPQRNHRGHTTQMFHLTLEKLGGGAVGDVMIGEYQASERV